MLAYQEYHDYSTVLNNSTIKELESQGVVIPDDARPQEPSSSSEVTFSIVDEERLKYFKSLDPMNLIIEIYMLFNENYNLDYTVFIGLMSDFIDNVLEDYEGKSVLKEEYLQYTGGKYDITPLEKIYFSFLYDNEKELLYFFLRIFRQQTLSKYFNVSQTSISYRQKRLKKKLLLIWKYVVPLYTEFNKIKLLLDRNFSDFEMSVLDNIIKTMNQSYGVRQTPPLYQAKVRYLVNSIRKKLKKSPQIELRNFEDSISKYLKWSVLGRTYHNCNN